MSFIVTPRRSVLYMPGANARAMEKAREIDCDGVIFDLEDAVAPEAKAGTRDRIGSAVNPSTTDVASEAASVYFPSVAER